MRPRVCGRHGERILPWPAGPDSRPGARVGAAAGSSERGWSRRRAAGAFALLAVRSTQPGRGMLVLRLDESNTPAVRASRDGRRAAPCSAGTAQGALPRGPRRGGCHARRKRRARGGGQLLCAYRLGPGLRGTAPSHWWRRLSTVLGRHAARGPGGLRRGDCSRGVHVSRHPGRERHGLSRRRSRLSRHVGAEQGGSGRLPRHPAQVRLVSEASAADLDTLVSLTERYCVVLQTIRHSPETTVSCSRVSAS